MTGALTVHRSRCAFQNLNYIFIFLSFPPKFMPTKHKRATVHVSRKFAGQKILTPVAVQSHC